MDTVGRGSTVPILVLLYAVPMVVILAGGLLAATRSASGSAPRHASARHRPGFVARVQSGFGRVSGCILALAAGTGVIIAVCWPIGYGARHFDRHDHAVYNWVLVRASTHWLHSAMSVLTKMSDNRESQVVAGIAMVVLTVWWFRDRTVSAGVAVLTPAALIFAAYELEHQLQHILKVLAHRTGPVPADVGAFPSGGVARLIAIYGLIAYLVLRRLGQTRSTWAVATWTLLVAATYTEAYSRLYLGKHWISDIVGGLVFGTLLLFVLIAAAQLLDRPDREPAASPVPARAGRAAAARSQPIARDVIPVNPGGERSAR